MLTQSSLKIVDPRAVCAGIICRRQQLQPDRVEFQAPESKHPLQRHGKNAAAFAIFCRKAASKENGHAKKKYENKCSTPAVSTIKCAIKAVAYLPLVWRDQSNGLSTVLTVSRKIAVGRENYSIADQLGHSYKTSVGQAHRRIIISTEQSHCLAELIRQ